jgi:flagellar protein FliO/FliZ
MIWMVVRLILSLAFVGVVLWFAARVAKRRGLGGGSALIEVVSRQRLGRASTVNLIRIGDVVLVVGATEEQVTLLAEIDGETLETALREQEEPREPRLPAPADDAPAAAAREQADRPAGGLHRPAATRPAGALAGSVFDRQGWGTVVHQMRERTVRRS